MFYVFAGVLVRLCGLCAWVWLGWLIEWALCVCPSHEPQSCSCDRASGSNETLVVGHFGPQVSEVLPGDVHAFHSCGCVFHSTGIEEQVISQHSGLNLVGSHAEDPWSHKKSDECH